MLEPAPKRWKRCIRIARSRTSCVSFISSANFHLRLIESIQINRTGGTDVIVKISSRARFWPPDVNPRDCPSHFSSVFFLFSPDYWLNVIKANTGWRLFLSSDCVKLFRWDCTSARRVAASRKQHGNIFTLTITMDAMRNNASCRAVGGCMYGMAWLEKWLEAISRVLTRRIVIDAMADSVELVV